ncbi:MAG: adenosylmethionine--8-amino-7-oxononanoate transaminase [Porticoccaceae bacterium]
MSDILNFDRQHLWHPYTSLTQPQQMLEVVSAKGCTLTLADGTELTDGTSSWWAAIQGYNHPELNQVIRDQLDDFAHVMFGGLTHKPAVDLGHRLLAITSPNLDAIFYSDSGSVAVEVGLKMALQYWQGVGKPEKNRFLTLRTGYHGDTFATMSFSDPRDGMHTRFSSVLHQPEFIDRPPPGFDKPVPQAYWDHLENVIEDNASTCAAVVMEPVVQNAGGMNIYNPAILTRIRELCDQHDLLLVLDEIATGFGRTGKWFACEHAGVQADILCVGKAMTAGYLSFAATLTSRDIAKGISGDSHDPLMHGPTYMGNALAARVAARNIEILQRGDWETQVATIEHLFNECLQPLLKLHVVKDVRVLGAIGIVELDRVPDLDKLQPALLEMGVWLRPFRNMIYAMPPYVISEAELRKLCGAIKEIIVSGRY